jgi:hypothetical protein
MLLLVLVLMNQARRPESWTWIWQLSGQAPPSPALLPTASTAQPQSTHQEATGQTGWPPGLDPHVLDNVRDDSHFRPAEQTAWFALWQILQVTPAEQLRSWSLGQTSYLQIYRQTQNYRGRLVDLQGVIRRAHLIQAPHNDVGIQQYWQCWLFPLNEPREPVVVYALDAPQRLRDSMTLDEPARLTAIVYKRWSYQAADGLQVAPVVLAKELTLLAPSTPPPGLAAPPTRPAAGPALMVLVVTALGAVLLVGLLFRYTAGRFGRRGRGAALPDTITPPVEGSDLR